MLPHVEAEDRLSCLPSSGCPGSRCSRSRACRRRRSARPSRCRTGRRPPWSNCSLNESKLPNDDVIASPTLPVGAPPLPGPMSSQNIVWLTWPPPLFRTAVRISSGTLLMPRTRSSTLLLLKVGRLLERRVQVVHIRRVMLVVMDPHRLLVDVRLEGVIGVWEWGYFVGHALLLSSSCQLLSAVSSQSAFQHSSISESQADELTAES